MERGQVCAKPGSITPHLKFTAQAYILTKEEGGRHTPFFNGYRPQFFFRTTDVTGTAQLPKGVEMVMPGDNVNLEINLITPIAMEKGLRFAIREGGRTVGAGTDRRDLWSKPMQENISLACTECKRRNYTTTKNKKTNTEKLELSKYCRFCRKHTAHKEGQESRNVAIRMQGCSSIGRAAVSKTVGWGFESLHPCHRQSAVQQ